MKTEETDTPINEEATAETAEEATENLKAVADDTPAEPTPEEVIGQWKEKVTYLAAEIENMKKRFVRERTDLMKMANEDLIKGILPVFDNLDLALKSIREAEAKAEGKVDAESEGAKLFANLLKGVDMTLVHFQQTLERLGVQHVDAEGEVFDPSKHEAMGQSTEEGVADNVVTSQFQKGFTLHGRVIRPAKVVVNKNTKA